MTDVRTVILPTPADVARRAAEELTETAVETVRLKGRVAVALSGGSTPIEMFGLLTREPFRSEMPWQQLHLFWSDERCVPPDSPDSNYYAANEALLSRVDIPEENVHRLRGEIEPDEAAREYERQIRAAVEGDPPRFDLILLGMGGDGHTASLFPHSDGLSVTDRLVVHNHVPDEHRGSAPVADRLTFTSTLINAAERVTFLVTGSGKADVLKAVLEGERDTEQYPSQLVLPADGKLLWLLDEAAASRLAVR